jgi:hypothetical protein
VQVVALLLAAGADCMVRNDLGHTPLDLARPSCSSKDWMTRLGPSNISPAQRQRLLAELASVGGSSIRQRVTQAEVEAAE